MDKVPKNKFLANNGRSDNGREYTSIKTQNYLKVNGLQQQLTVPYSAPQSGVNDRKK